MATYPPPPRLRTAPPLPAAPSTSPVPCRAGPSSKAARCPAGSAGFPPFTGGPFRYIDRIGVSKYVDTLNQLADKHGERFKPAPLLVDYAKAGRKFYP